VFDFEQNILCIILHLSSNSAFFCIFMHFRLVYFSCTSVLDTSWKAVTTPNRREHTYSLKVSTGTPLHLSA
jgi:hypothetical protein